MSKLLVVVDYQVDFVSGSLGFPKAVELESKIVNRIKLAIKEGWDIIYTLDTHFDNYLETNEGKHLPVKHCIKGTDGHKLYGSVSKLPRPNDKIIEKLTFGSMELAEIVGKKKYDEIHLVGLVSDICVVSNSLIVKAFSPESLIIVDSSLIATFDDKLQDATLTILKSNHIEVI